MMRPARFPEMADSGGTKSADVPICKVPGVFLCSAIRPNGTKHLGSDKSSVPRHPIHYKKVQNIMRHSMTSPFNLICMLVLTCMCLAAPARANMHEDYFRAVAMNNPDEVVSYLQKGVNPNAVEKDRGYSGLMIALFENATEVFNVLVNLPNIDLEATAPNGNNALMIAAFKGNQAAFDALLKKGVAINKSDWTPLHYAAASGQNKFIQILLEKGADINARSPNRTTPLMMAAYEGYYYSARLLLERGADATLRNELGLNAFDLTRRLDRQDIRDLLNEHLKKTRLVDTLRSEPKN
ncbi:hypothetical protein BH11PSE11_BH11PSE11_01650 [soil metagenome]